MANEVRVKISVVSTNGGANKRMTVSFNASIAVNGGGVEEQKVGIIEEVLAVPSDVTAIGLILIKNLDSINYLQYGLTSGVYTGRILAGEGALIRLDTGSVLFLKANVELWIKKLVLPFS